MRRELRTDVLIGLLILAFTAVPTGLQPPRPGAFADAFRFRPDLVDLVANILGYLPLGLALAKRRPLWVLVLAGALTAGAESIQLFSVGRNPSLVDVAANVLGACLGRALAARWQLLPERIAITRRRAVLAAILALAYVVSGAGLTAEAIMGKVSAWLVAPPWMTNSRGALSRGTLEGHWPFDAADHGSTKDDSGQGLNGRIVNAAKFPPGISGAAIRLDGRQWIDLGATPSLRLTGSMTLSAWVEPHAFPPDDAAIISSRTGNELGYQLDLTIDQGQRTVGFKLAAPDGHLMARYGKTPILADHWYHVAGVYDAAARTLDIYLNGQLDNGCLIGDVADRQQPAGGHVFVGRRAGSSGFEFTGSIDEVEIQSRAISRSGLQAQLRAAGRDPGSPTVDDKGYSAGDGSCLHVHAKQPPRIAGPLLVFGMMMALICAGLWRGARYDVVALGLCLLGGATTRFWLSGAVATGRGWLPAALILSGGVAVVLVIRLSARRQC